MTTVAGLDGCRGAWCVVELDVQGDTVTATAPAIRTFSDVVASQAEIICVDIPIGLLDGPGRRYCDTDGEKAPGPASRIQRLPLAMPIGALDGFIIGAVSRG